eukprot:scaffold36304_cov121-Isochrysis_galbana.AAC.13
MCRIAINFSQLFSVHTRIARIDQTSILDLGLGLLGLGGLLLLLGVPFQPPQRHWAVIARALAAGRTCRLLVGRRLARHSGGLAIGRRMHGRAHCGGPGALHLPPNLGEAVQLGGEPRRQFRRVGHVRGGGRRPPPNKACQEEADGGVVGKLSANSALRDGGGGARVDPVQGLASAGPVGQR